MKKYINKVQESYSSLNIKHKRYAIVTGTFLVIVLPALILTAIYIGNRNNEDTKAAGVITIFPPQPGAVIYNSDAPSSYARAGAMVDMNSAETPGAKAVSNAGGTVLVYVDTIADGSGGNYAGMINNANYCGPAIGRWPGANRFNDYGYVRDLRILVNSGKLKCILEKVVADNPHMGGFFADDLGTTNPQYSGSIATPKNGCSAPTDEFYNAAVNTMKVFRQVADAHGLMVMSNGSWAGPLCNGGYPIRSQHGTSLAEGWCIEHHSRDAFFAAYTGSSQWADASPITKGQPAHFAIVSPGDSSWNSDPNVAWVAQQNTYASAPPIWTSNFHPTGLPTKVGGSFGTVPAPAPAPAPAPSPTPTTTTQSPYGGSARTLPGKVEAEDFDNGGQNISFYDNDSGNNGAQYRSTAVDIENSQEGGYSVGWTGPGEWLEYTANSSASTYKLDLRVASAVTGSKLVLKSNGTTVATVDIPNTGGWYSQPK